MCTSTSVFISQPIHWSTLTVSYSVSLRVIHSVFVSFSRSLSYSVCKSATIQSASKSVTFWERLFSQSASQPLNHSVIFFGHSLSQSDFLFLSDQFNPKLTILSREIPTQTTVPVFSPPTTIYDNNFALHNRTNHKRVHREQGNRSTHVPVKVVGSQMMDDPTATRQHDRKKVREIQATKRRLHNM